MHACISASVKVSYSHMGDLAGEAIPQSWRIWTMAHGKVASTRLQLKGTYICVLSTSSKTFGKCCTIATSCVNRKCEWWVGCLRWQIRVIALTKWQKGGWETAQSPSFKETKDYATEQIRKKSFTHNMHYTFMAKLMCQSTHFTKHRHGIYLTFLHTQIQ